MSTSHTPHRSTSLSPELIKLRRSLGWPVAIVLPIVAVASAAIGTLGSEQGLTEGWHTLWIRSIGFYGMALLPVGIAILASLVWRVEHRSGNWNALMCLPVPTWRIVAGKLAAIAVFVSIMQMCLLAAVFVIGTLVFDLPTPVPGRYVVGGLLVIIACVPVAALQSGLSAILRSFAAPVAIGLVATGMSTVALLIGSTAAIISPYALATFATQLGTSLVDGGTTSFEAAAITPGSAVLVAAVSTAATVIIVMVTTVALDRIDTRT